MSTRSSGYVIAGVDVVLPDHVLERGSLVIEDGVVKDVLEHERPWPSSVVVEDARNLYCVPGFVDVHVHGIAGVDLLDGSEAVRAVARRMPQRGVTAFCPTAVACDAETLEQFLSAVSEARRHPESGAARVLPAHLESNFIARTYAGAQNPQHILDLPPGPVSSWTMGSTFQANSNQPNDGGSEELGAGRTSFHDGPEDHSRTAQSILTLMERFRPDIAIVTMAPEIDRGMDLLRWVVDRGWIASLGHSAASFEQAIEAIEAGASHATHLFNRMPPMSHRAPGLVGAVLSSGAVTAEIVCDGYHVHPAVVRTTVAAKGLHKVMAISDGTAGTSCAEGTTVRLGGRPIVVGEQACFLPGGTVLAGSRCAMDEAFRFLIGPVGLAPAQAAYLCSTSACRHLGMRGFGVIGPGAPADLTLLDRHFRVARTMVGGVWSTAAE